MTILVSYLQNGGIEYTARDFRQLIAGVVSEGVGSPTDLKVEADSPAGLTMLVQPGRAFIEGDDVAYQGTYLFVSDAEVGLDVTASKPGSGYRVIIVYAQVHDDEADSSGLNNGVISFIAGTTVTSGTAAAPTLPDNALELNRFILRSTTTGITYSTDSASNAQLVDTRVGAGSALTALYPPQHNQVQTASTKQSSTFSDPTGDGGPTIVAIVAPPSGKLKVSLTCVFSHEQGAGHEALMSYEVRLGSSSGTVVQGADQSHATKTQSAENVGGALVDLVEGLTPGATYYIRAKYAATNTTGGATASFSLRHLLVDPVV